jgi:hypothetical protein
MDHHLPSNTCEHAPAPNDPRGTLPQSLGTIEHCSRCGDACSETQTCDDGACTEIRCKDGEEICDRECVVSGAHGKGLGVLVLGSGPSGRRGGRVAPHDSVGLLVVLATVSGACSSHDDFSRMM